MSARELDRVDVHAHGFPEGYLRRIAQLYPDKVRLREPEPGGGLLAVWAGAPLPAWDREARLGEMDRDHVTIEVLSAPSIYSWLDEHTAVLCAELNDFQAEMVRAEPDRFRSFLHLPVHDADASRRELARWRGRTGIAGVLFGSNMGGIYPGEPALLPIWEMIHEARLPVFIHPIAPATCFGPMVAPIALFPCDTTMAAASIIYAGIFERLPGIAIILSHYGGALPFLASRLDMAVDVPGFPAGHGQGLPAPPASYVSRFFVDAAQGFHRPAFECARAVVGIERILYGSDHFFLKSPWRARLNQFLDSLALSPRERALVLRENAQAVLSCL